MAKRKRSFLDRMGYTGTKGKTWRGSFPDLSTDVEGLPPLSNSITAFDSAPKERPILTEYVVGQAYNKGGFQVLSKLEQKDPATGKRRA